MVNSCLKNNSLISLECDFYNFLYSIEVMERYSYKKGLLQDCISISEGFTCTFFSSTQREARDIFNQDCALGYIQ